MNEYSLYFQNISRVSVYGTYNSHELQSLSGVCEVIEVIEELMVDCLYHHAVDGDPWTSERHSPSVHCTSLYLNRHSRCLLVFRL